MSLIRSRGNKDTELVLAKLLRANQITGWRRHVQIRGRADLRLGKGVGGDSKFQAALRRGSHIGAARQRRPTRPFSVKPDFVFKEVRLALFVDGCFWHGCPRHATKPKTNRAFWNKKLAGNIARDLRVNRTLRRAGWRVIRIWECQLRQRPLAGLARIRRGLAV
ncbi:MAG TPA: DNA mismatch endonuclease Vsr [Candidatus Sulfotelmatobacter sp.]|nr:DNA mismatch endonuclease Vsr [Candidatus Sulfotelmatobacter sp.]